MTFHEHPHTGASHNSRYARKNPRSIVTEAISDAEDIKAREKIFEEFRTRVEADEERESLQRAIDWYFFLNMYEYEVTNRSGKKKNRKMSAAAVQAGVEKLKEQVTKVALLNIMLPTGKLLRDSTFGECATLGGWFARLAKKGRPAQLVGKVMTEEQLRALRL